MHCASKKIHKEIVVIIGIIDITDITDIVMLHKAAAPFMRSRYHRVMLAVHS